MYGIPVTFCRPGCLYERRLLRCLAWWPESFSVLTKGLKGPILENKYFRKINLKQKKNELQSNKIQCKINNNHINLNLDGMTFRTRWPCLFFHNQTCKISDFPFSEIADRHLKCLGANLQRKHPHGVYVALNWDSINTGMECSFKKRSKMLMLCRKKMDKICWFSPLPAYTNNIQLTYCKCFASGLNWKCRMSR